MRCPACNTENGKDASRCGSCGGPLGRPRRKRRSRRAAEDADAPFADSVNGPNRPAARAYRVCVAGLIPGLGLVLGPLGMLLGGLAWYRGRSESGFTAGGLAVGSVLLGGLIALSNWLGLALMLWGLRGSGGP